MRESATAKSRPTAGTVELTLLNRPGVTPFSWTLENALIRLHRSLTIAEWGDSRLRNTSKSTSVDLRPKKNPEHDLKLALS